VEHCHPVAINVAGCKWLNGNKMPTESDVSDLNFVLSFLAAAMMANWRDERRPWREFSEGKGKLVFWLALILTISRPPSPRLPPPLNLLRTGWRIFEEKETSGVRSQGLKRRGAWIRNLIDNRLIERGLHDAPVNRAG
jgi:hypothetical protein